VHDDDRPGNAQGPAAYAMTSMTAISPASVKTMRSRPGRSIVSPLAVVTDAGRAVLGFGVEHRQDGRQILAAGTFDIDARQAGVAGLLGHCAAASGWRDSPSITRREFG
jgi:hypothetical protein